MRSSNVISKQQLSLFGYYIALPIHRHLKGNRILARARTCIRTAVVRFARRRRSISLIYIYNGTVHKRDSSLRTLGTNTLRFVYTFEEKCVHYDKTIPFSSRIREFGKRLFLGDDLTTQRSNFCASPFDSEN